MHIYLLLLTYLEEVDDVIEPVKEPDWLAGGGGSAPVSDGPCNIQ